MYVIASERPWNARLADRLSGQTGLPFMTIRNKQDLTAENLRRLEVRTVFLPHWSHIVPREVYDAFECVIFHMTDVPFGRGGSPLQNMIVRGASETVISALRCEAGLDSGPVYLKRPLSLHGSAEEVFLRADLIIEEMVLSIVRNPPVPVAQAGEVVTFPRRRPEESDLSGCVNLDKVYDYIRMLDADGFPQAFVDVGPFRLEFSRAARKVDAVVADVRIFVRDGTQA